MIACLAFLAVTAAAGFAYLYLAAHYRWNQQPQPKGWDGVERRTVRSRPYLPGVAVTDVMLDEFRASLAAEYALAGAR